jgi:sugar lactone lactonase YvrE
VRYKLHKNRYHRTHLFLSFRPSSEPINVERESSSDDASCINTSYDRMILTINICHSRNHVYKCLSLLVIPDARWAQNGIPVAGGHDVGDGLRQLNHPYGLVVDDDDTVFIADAGNHRIVAYKKGDNGGRRVPVGQGYGSRLHQLYELTDLLIVNETKSLIIYDQVNRRVVRWPLNNGIRGEVLVDNIVCRWLAMHNQGCLYSSDFKKHEVRQFTRGDTKRIVAAGGNGKGYHLNQINYPYNIFVNEEQSLYVSDSQNHRLLKWMKGAVEGIVVVGGNEQRKERSQLSYPDGVWVDEMGTVYVAEECNQRVTRWLKDETRGVLVVGGNGEGNATNQFNCPEGLSFDRQGNMYVADCDNHRVQQFKLNNN